MRLPVLLLLFDFLCLAAQDPLDRVLDQLSRTRRPAQVAISPDGRRAAWVEETHGRAPGVSGRAIYTIDLKVPGPPRRITAAPDPKRIPQASQERTPAWSPDGSQLLFVSDAAKLGRTEVYAATISTGAARKVAGVAGVADSPAWSRDGKHVLYLATEGAAGSLGPLEAAEGLTGVVDEAFHNQRLMIAGANGDAPRAISRADLHVYEYDESPDGKRIAVLAAPGPGDNNWWTAQMFLIERETGQMTLAFAPPAGTQLAVPRWSPDGRSIAFLAGLMSDQSVNGGEVYLLDVASGTARNLTPRRKSSPNSVTWVAPGKLLVTEWAGGGSRIVLLDALSGEARIAWSGDEGVYSNGYGPTFDVARDGVTSVVVRSSFSEAPEVWAGPIGQWRQVTHLNSDQHAEWGEAKSVEWDSDGMRVQGWLIAPKDVSGTVRYPLVVEAHGGPASVAHPGWPREFFSAVPLAAAGYYVFLPNPRGSYGQGEDFTRANVKDFGGGDLRDILAGIDKVLEIAPVDQKRIGLTGWSYGGFMTMFAVTQTDRFRAAVAGAGIANWQSYYGENSIDQWMIPYFGATVYADAAPYARASAINFITRVKTPTLVVVGERDGECPAPQSFEFWHALKTLGVKTQLVVYPGEGHGFRKPDHRRDVFRRMAAWFQENLR